MTEESFEAAAQLGCSVNRQLEREPVQPLLEITGRNRHRRRINALAFSADGGLLASGGDDGTVRLWDVRTGEHLATASQEKPCWPIDALGNRSRAGV